MSRAWMPLYIADYLGDTRRLSTLEHGAYILLIMDYWQKGELPTDDATLARIAGLSPKQWASVKPNIEKLFLPGWRHKRIISELQRADERAEKARVAAERRWSKPLNYNNVDNADASSEHAVEHAVEHMPRTDASNAAHNHSHRREEKDPFGVQKESSPGNNPPNGRARPEPRPKRGSAIPPNLSLTPEYVAAADKIGVHPGRRAAEFAKFCDHHAAKGTLMKDWLAAWRTWCRYSVERFGRATGPPQPSPSGFSRYVDSHGIEWSEG